MTISNLSFENINVFLMILVFLMCNLKAVHVILGISLGKLIGCMTGAYPELTSLMMICISHNQTTAIPLYYAEVLGTRQITNPDPNFEFIAPSYVLIFAVFTIFSNWTVAYR